MSVPEFLLKTDWTMLKEQKQLLIAANTEIADQTQKDAIEGILSLIDAIQDYAVADMGVPEDSVFNDTEPETKSPVYSCPRCGSKNVEIKMWVNANTNKMSSQSDDDEGWCADCETHSPLNID